MVKVRAYFSDGLFKEFDTYLPLTREIDDLISKEYYGMDYVVLESDFDRNKIKMVQNFVNECYDLLEMDEFAQMVESWDESMVDKFIRENNITEDVWF